MKSSTHAIMTLLSLIWLAFSPVAHAAPSAEQAALNYLKDRFSEVDVNRISRISQEMSLDEKTAQKFWPRYQAYLHQQIDLRDKQLSSLTTYAAHLSQQSLTQAAAADLLRASMANEAQRLANRQQLIKGLHGILSATQQMRLYQIELLIDAQMRSGLLTQIPLAE